MNVIAERKNVLEEQEKSTKISELYDLVQRSEGTAQALPEVVDRLDALQGLHEQGIKKKNVPKAVFLLCSI